MQQATALTTGTASHAQQMRRQGTFLLDAQAGDDRIQESVGRMQRIIELCRVIRETKRKPLKTPLQALVVVHPDQSFLDDISGELLKTCNAPSCFPLPVQR